MLGTFFIILCSLCCFISFWGVKTSYQLLLQSKIILFHFQDLTSEVIDSPNSEADSSANYDDNKSVLHAVNYVGKGKEQPFLVQ